MPSTCENETPILLCKEICQDTMQCIHRIFFINIQEHKNNQDF